jgi:hypothetical protein
MPIFVVYGRKLKFFGGLDNPPITGLTLHTTCTQRLTNTLWDKCLSF